MVPERAAQQLPNHGTRCRAEEANVSSGPEQRKADGTNEANETTLRMMGQSRLKILILNLSWCRTAFRIISTIAIP
jgi:hypothetical protein